MPTPADFLEATQWAAILTLVLAGITAIAFVAQWGIRFRLVGATGFMGVLTVGFLGLSFEPFTRTSIPGAIPYTTVFDSGAAQIVIKVPQTITESELAATLQQAASNLLKPGRLGPPGQIPTIRARTIVHRPDGISDLVYLGQLQPVPDEQTGAPQTIRIDQSRLAQISKMTDLSAKDS
ncbi:Ycf51 family protein [Almyronema epifaneia]|uniref:Ycf51 family protein n=1 Tax=Almyronema epifaneia S1 TaxID=2991925 RepID=A0ABW6IG72_9CYAN